MQACFLSDRVDPTPYAVVAVATIQHPACVDWPRLSPVSAIVKLSTAPDNAAFVNLCRDEATDGLKTQIDTVFGNSFNTNGLGAVLTCGVTGIKAGASHSPIVRPCSSPLACTCLLKSTAPTALHTA